MIDTAQEEEKTRAQISEHVGQDVTPPGEKSPSILAEGADAVGSHFEELLGGALGGSTIETADNKKENLSQRVLNRFRRKNPQQVITEKAA